MLNTPLFDAASRRVHDTLRLRNAGLNSMAEIAVLSVFVRGASLDDDPTTAITLPEIARETGYSVEQAKTATRKLVEAGHLVRLQTVKRAGQAAKTLVTTKAFAAFGLEGGAVLPTDMPEALKKLLVGQGRAVCELVATCWQALRVPTAAEASSWEGSSRSWEEVLFFLTARVETELAALDKACTAEEARERQEASGVFVFETPGGETIQLDERRFADIAPRVGSMRFARDVLARLARLRPDHVTAASVPTLVAEILFTRCMGFCWPKGVDDAERILVSTMLKPTWSKPRGIDDHWYRAAHASVRPC